MPRLALRTILVVTTDESLRARIERHLHDRAYRFFFADDEHDARTILKSNPIHALVLDIGDGEAERVATCRRLRSHAVLPTILLAAQAATEAVLTAFAFGVDDYLLKPPDPHELGLRLDARLRHYDHQSNGASSSIITFGPNVVNLVTKQLFRDGQPIACTLKAWEVLVELVQAPHQLLTNQTLLRRIWGEAYIDERQYVRIRIRELRKALEPDPKSPRYLLTAPDGYRFVPDAEKSTAHPANADLIAAMTRPTYRIPTPATSFIGRAALVAQVCSLLRDDAARLVTLTGVGGIGKTRLALAAAHQLADHFADGVAYVPLAAIRDPDLVLPTIAHCLEIAIRPHETAHAAFVRALRDRHLLLVLDNLEQVLAVGPLLSALLPELPTLSMLITSRVPLHLSAEYVRVVEPLALPDGRAVAASDGDMLAESVQLFCARAQQVTAPWVLDGATIPAVLAICHRLEGIPLAIELAAGRCGEFAPTALLAQLDHRLALLVGGPRDLPERQQTLRTTIAWSYELLPDAERTLLAQLGVFRDGWTADAALAVCDAPEASEPRIHAVLETLVQHHLITKQTTADNNVRFGMLETLREYALLRLDAQPDQMAVFQRHAAFFLALAEAADTELAGADQSLWLTHLAREHDNLRTALAWAQDHRPDWLLRLATALGTFWYRRGYLHEGRQWLDIALTYRPTAPLLLRVRALNAAGVLALGQSDYPTARHLFEEGALFGRAVQDDDLLATMLCNLAIVLQELDHYDEAQALFTESLEILRAQHNRSGVAFLLNNLGVLAYNRGDLTTAQRYATEALDLTSTLADSEGILIALDNLGMVARERADYPEATTLFTRALALSRDLEDPHTTAHVLTNLGITGVKDAQYGQARSQLEEALQLYLALDDRQGMVEALEAFANVCAKTGDLFAAAQLWGTAEAARAQLRIPHTAIDRLRYRVMIDDLRQQLDSQQFAQAMEVGRCTALQDAITTVVHRYQEAEDDSDST